MVYQYIVLELSCLVLLLVAELFVTSAIDTSPTNSAAKHEAISFWSDEEDLSSSSEIKYLEDHTIENDYSLPLPYTYVKQEDLPESFNWSNVNGTSYLTCMLNQHLPQCKC